MPLTVAVNLSPRDREVLQSWLRAPSLRAGLAQRARIVLLAADGVAVKDIVARVGVSKPTVIGWKKRYIAEGLAGLEDRPKPGRRRVVEEAAVVSATLEPPPERGRVPWRGVDPLAGGSADQIMPSSVPVWLLSRRRPGAPAACRGRSRAGR